MAQQAKALAGKPEDLRSRRHADLFWFSGSFFLRDVL